MTMREWMMEGYPCKVVDYTSGVIKCPYKYGIERRNESEANCKRYGGKGCDYCWSREMPDIIIKVML